MKVPILYQIENFLRNFKKITPIKHVQPSYSQFGEDIFLREFFRNQHYGFYVDIGAYHPYRFSNTLLLYRKGWRGINIEPNPISYKKIQNRKRDINLNLAVSTMDGNMQFNIHDAMSGIMYDSYILTGKETGEAVIVNTRPLSAILDEYLPKKKEIDFFSIDCEGHDLEVIKSNNWDKYRPKIVLVEDHNLSLNSEINRQMRDLGYKYYIRMNITKIFLEKGIADQYIPTDQN